MIVNQQALRGIYTSFKVIFNKAFENAEPQHTKVATVIPSSAGSENYKWLGKIPRMREWIGDRVIQNLSAYDYTIKNKDFEVTIGVDRNDIEDDTIGVYRPLIEQIGESAKLHPDELVFELLLKGFEEKCYDGQPFFSASHKEEKSGTQSNKSEFKLEPRSYGAARTQMRSLKDDQGKVIKVNPNLLVVSPQNEDMAKKILTAEKIDGEVNIYKGTAELLVVPELADVPNAWFLLDVSRPIRPIIFQQRKAPQFVAKDNIDDDNVFFQKQFIYGADSRDNAGYGLWQLAFGSTGTKSMPA